MIKVFQLPRKLSNINFNLLLKTNTMKKLLLSLLLLWQFNCELKAQSSVYKPFPADSAIWYEDAANNTPTYTRTLTKMLGDTIINNQTYNKLYKAGFQSGQQSMPSSVPTNYSYFGAIREDVPAKKIYFISPTLSTNNEVLVYDFSAAIGDTIFFDPFHSQAFYLVTSTDSVLVGNKFHKRFSVQSPVISLDTPGKIIEGVGSDAGLFEMITFTVNSTSNLMCFSIGNNQRLYPMNTSLYYCPFSITIGISDLINDKISLNIMPNPTSEMVTLQVNCDGLYIFRIQNELGQIVYSNQKSAFSNTSFDFSDYKSGIYFITISDDKGNSATKKIIKQ